MAVSGICAKHENSGSFMSQFQSLGHRTKSGLLVNSGHIYDINVLDEFRMSFGWILDGYSVSGIFHVLAQILDTVICPEFILLT
jgi:hypothetical protein